MLVCSESSRGMWTGTRGGDGPPRPIRATTFNSDGFRWDQARPTRRLMRSRQLGTCRKGGRNLNRGWNQCSWVDHPRQDLLRASTLHGSDRRRKGGGCARLLHQRCASLSCIWCRFARCAQKACGLSQGKRRRTRCLCAPAPDAIHIMLGHSWGIRRYGYERWDRGCAATRITNIS